MLSLKALILIFSFQQYRDNTEAADTAGEKPEEDVGRGDQPKCEDIDHRVAVVLSSSQLLASLGPVDTIHPHAPCDKPSAQEECDK